MTVHAPSKRLLRHIKTAKKQVVALRKSMGLTQAQLAELTGFTQQTISGWESPKTVRLPTMAEWALMNGVI